MRKRWSFMSAMLCIFIWITAASVSAASNGYTYKVLSDGTLEITGCTLRGDVVIPKTLDGRTVTHLARELFQGVWGVTSITLPDSITEIGDWDYVFSYCYDLEAIKVNSTNQGLCSVNGVLFNKSKTKLYNWPCNKNVEEYHVPSTVNFICCTAFARAFHLKTLYIDNKEAEFMTYTFFGDGDLTVYYQPGSVTESYVNRHISYDMYHVKNTDYPTYKKVPLVQQMMISNVKNAEKGLKVIWKKQSGVLGYQIYRKKSGETDYTLLKTISNANTESWIDTKAAAAVTYYYKVRAYKKDESGSVIYGAASPSFGMRRLLKPSVTVKNANTGIQISWSTQKGVTGYQIYKKKAGASRYSLAKTVTGAKANSWTDTSVTEGQTYLYKVKASFTNSLGLNALSLDSDIKEQTCIKQAAILSCHKTSQGKKLTWKSKTGITGYQIYKKQSDEATYQLVKKIGKATTTSWTDTIGTEEDCSYKIRAYYTNKNGKTFTGTFSKAIK